MVGESKKTATKMYKPGTNQEEQTRNKNPETLYRQKEKKRQPEERE